MPTANSDPRCPRCGVKFRPEIHGWSHTCQDYHDDFQQVDVMELLKQRKSMGFIPEPVRELGGSKR